MCHVYPGVTPFNIWQLPYYTWRLLNHNADAYL